MILDQRRREILDVLRDRGYASLHDLVEAVGASESTVRRDLDSLHGEGSVKRTRGGAMFVSPADDGSPPASPGVSAPVTAASPHAAAKAAIGRAAAKLIEPGQTVLIDGGTTPLEVARHLASRRVQVVTNSLPVVNALFGQPSVDVVMLGGLVSPKTGVALGAITDAALETFRVPTLVFGCGGVRDDAIYNQNSLLVEAQRRMLDAADRRILVADSSKFGHAELVRLCSLDRVDRLVTDDGLSEEWRSRIEDAGIALTIAS